MAGIIEIENLVKDYEVGFFRKRRVRALDSLSLTVNEGEIFGFLAFDKFLKSICRSAPSSSFQPSQA